MPLFDMLPVTFFYDFESVSDRARPAVMNEFAANGARHLVLSFPLMRMIAGDPGLFRALRIEAADAGLDFVDAHTPFRDDCDPNCPDPAVRPFMLAYLKFMLRIVHDFGIGSCCVHIGNVFRRGYTPGQHRDAMCRTLDEILPLAERLDVTICLENIFIPLNTVDDLLFYFERYPSKHLGACFDSGHANIMEKGMTDPECRAPKRFAEAGMPNRLEHDVLDRMLPYIVNCHLHDNDGVTDRHLLPGMGTVDWAGLVPKLLSAPRLACVQSEVIPLRNRLSIRALCDKFRELFGDI